jgi:hypothetical protein
MLSKIKGRWKSQKDWGIILRFSRVLDGLTERTGMPEEEFGNNRSSGRKR